MAPSSECAIGLSREGISMDQDTVEHGLTDDVESPVKRICLRECSVKLERLELKEIMVTAPTRKTREVFYVSTYDDEDDDETESSSSGNDKYEDWRLETVEALDFRKKRKRIKTSTTEPPLKLLISIPEIQDYVFSVNDVKGDLHMIMSILSGEAMATSILEAYLMLRLEKYWKMNSHTQFQKDGKEVKKMSPINYQYLSYQFMPVEDRDQPKSSFKVNMNHFPPLEKEVLHSCRLIAPQFASKHFYLAVFDFPKRRVQLLDSSWHYLPIKLRKRQCKTILRALTTNYKDWRFDLVQKSSPQYDEYSCGIYAIYYAETLLKGVSIKRNYRKVTNKTVKEVRKRIVKDLLKTTTLGRKILRALTYS